MAEILLVFNLGEKGVNVDLDPLQLEDNQFRKTQNAISDPLGVEMGLTNRPGLIEFNATAANGVILGGIGVPLQDLHSGNSLFYIGRGPL